MDSSQIITANSPQHETPNGLNRVSANTDVLANKVSEIPEIHSGLDRISEIPEIRIGVGGNVDAGKSSFVGVMTRDILDNGRGFARSFVLRHKHEQETGRTSSSSQQYIRTPYKIIEFNDLAGHEKYYKCTAKQLATNFLDYVAIVINSGSGIQMMTREHISLAYSLRIPMFIIYTKIDATPSNIYEINLEYIKTFYKNKMNLNIEVITPDISKPSSLSSLISKCKFGKSGDIVPLFPISNVAGTGITQIKEFLVSLNKSIDYKEDETRAANFLIARTYQVQGIGIVLSGIMRAGTIRRNDTLYIGPNATGCTRDTETNIITDIPQDANPNFYKVIIKGIHNNFKETVDFLKAGYSGCVNVKSIGRNVIKRSMIRPGMRLLGDIHSVFQFQAKVKICNSSSTITNKYQPVVHCGGISQSVRIVAMDKEYLRSYDEGVITFRFMYRPEYLEVGNIFIMREGNLKALGKVLKIDK